MGGPGTYPVHKPKTEKVDKKKLATEEEGDDCSKLAKAAGECTGGKGGGREADDANKDKERKDKESKTTRDAYWY